MSAMGGGPVFYYLTDPVTAQEIIEHGFPGSRGWNAASTVTLLDRVPDDVSDGVLCIGLSPENTAAAYRREASDHGEGYRKFLVPMGLLTDARLAHVKVGEEQEWPSRGRDRNAESVTKEGSP
jgi:hypothetical protein